MPSHLISGRIPDSRVISRDQFIKGAGLQHLTVPNLIEIVRKYVVTRATKLELVDILYVLKHRRAILPLIPKGGLKNDTFLLALYAVRGIAYPDKLQSLPQQSPEENELQNLIESRIARFSVIPTKKVVNYAIGNPDNLCAYQVRLFLESTFSGNVRRSEFYPLIDRNDQNTFPPGASKEEKIIRLKAKAQAPRRLRLWDNTRPYLSDPLGPLASYITLPLAGLIFFQVGKFGNTMLRIIRDMLKNKINQLSIWGRLSDPILSHIIGLSIEFQTGTLFIKMLIFDPNDKTGHRRIYFHKNEIFSNELCKPAVGELQKYMVSICNNSQYNSNTTLLALLFFKSIDTPAMLPHYIPERSEVSPPGDLNFNRFISTGILTLIPEIPIKYKKILEEYIDRLLKETHARLVFSVVDTGFTLLELCLIYEMMKMSKKIIAESQGTSRLNYESALIKVSEYGVKPSLDLLLSTTPVDITSTSGSPYNRNALETAIASDQIRSDNTRFYIVEKLMEKARASLRPFNYATPLILATSSGRDRMIGIIFLLLSDPSASNIINVPDAFGYTPLHMVIFVRGFTDPIRLEIIKFLLRAGADPNIALRGQTALALAQTHNRSAEIIVLLQNHAAFLVTPPDYSNVLHFAVRSGDQMFAYFLLHVKNVDANVRDDIGLTPLHAAMDSDDLTEPERFKMTQMLLDAHANPNIVVNLDPQSHFTPLDVARNMGRSPEVQKLLSS